MSFRINDPRNGEQLSFDNRFVNLSEREKKILLNSWAKDFSDIIYPAINEERFSVLYSGNAASRPNTPVIFIIGALILGSLLGLTEDDLKQSILFDIRFQYALHTDHLSEQPISDRTFSRFRERLHKYENDTGIDLMKEEMLSLTSVMAEFMELDHNIKRMDSMMIASRCKSMTRLEIFYKVNFNAVRLLDKNGRNDLIPEELMHYLEKYDENKVIYYSKDDELQTQFRKVISETELLLNVMSEEEWGGYLEYKLLKRVIEEQCRTDDNGNTIPKENKELSPNFLQNPSEPDATFRRKAGRKHVGYTANIVETTGKEGDSLITDISFENNSHNDCEFCREYLESRDENAEQETVVTDGAYSSDDNFKLAEKKNVELVCTALTGAAPDTIYSDFEMTEDGQKVLRCPAGHEPICQRYNERTEGCSVLMSSEVCDNCQYRERCGGKKQKNGYKLNVSAKKIFRARYIR